MIPWRVRIPLGITPERKKLTQVGLSSRTFWSCQARKPDLLSGRGNTDSFLVFDVFCPVHPH